MKKVLVSVLIMSLFLGACGKKEETKKDDKTEQKVVKEEKKKEETKEEKEEVVEPPKEENNGMDENERNPELLKVATPVEPSTQDKASIQLLSTAWNDSTFATYGTPIAYKILDWQTVGGLSFMYLSDRIAKNNDMRIYQGGTYVGESGATYELLDTWKMTVVDKDVLSKYSLDYLGVDILTLPKIDDPQNRNSFDYIPSLEGYRIFYDWPVGGVPGIRYKDEIHEIYNYKDTYIVEGRAVTWEQEREIEVKTYLFLHKVAEGDFNLMWGFVEF